MTVPATAPVSEPESPVGAGEDVAGGTGSRWGGRWATGRLVASLAVCAGVPLAVLGSLWPSLTTPFWFNEYWRAEYISYPGGWWAALRDDQAPFPAGWYFLERFTGELFGSTELSLRLATAVFLPLSCVLLYLLARRWMPDLAAVVVALVGCLTGDLLNFSVQLSEYVVDVAAVVAILLLHELGDEGTRSRRTVALCYGGIALACVLSTPAVFVAGPLLLFDVSRGLWRRAPAVQVVAAFASGAVILVHLGTFVMRQNALTEGSYWDAQFAPHHGVGRLLAFAWDGGRGFVTEAFADTGNAPFSFGSRPWGTVLDVVFVVLLVLGVVATARSRRGRSLLVGIGSPLVLSLVASYVRYWPFGFARTNLYQVPMLVLLAGIGAADTVRRLVGHETGGARTSGRRSPLLMGAAAVVVAVGLLGAGVAGSYEGRAFAQLRAAQPPFRWGNAVRSVVAEARREERRRAAVVVAGAMAIPGWQYYLYEYDGRATQTGPQLNGQRVLFVPGPGPAMVAFLRRSRPTEVFLYFPDGTTIGQLNEDILFTAVGAACRQQRSQTLPLSGSLVRFTHCGGGVARTGAAGRRASQPVL